MVLCCDWLSWIELLLLLVAAYVIYMCWHFRLFTKQGVPMAETPIPILGTTLPLIRKGFLEAGRGCIEKYGKTYGGISGRMPVLTSADPEILREVFIKDHTSFPYRFTFSGSDSVEENMLQNVKDYAHWKALRSTMSPTFSSGKLKQMMKQINKCAATYATHLTKEQDKSVEMKENAGSFTKEQGTSVGMKEYAGSFTMERDKALEMKEYAASFTMDVIASTAFGLDLNTKEDRNNPFVQHVVKALDIKTNSPQILCLTFFPFLEPVLRSLKVGFIDKSAKEFFAEICNQVLDSRSKDDGAVDFIQLMKNAHEEKSEDKKRAMSRQEIVAQGVLFFLGGYDTTALSISYLAYNLACNPATQDKLIEEVERVLADKEEVSDEDLQKMTYLDMCVSESLRLFPPAPALSRMADRDVVLKGIHLPKGSMVVAPVYYIHRLTEYYPQPEAFIPERFSPEEKAKRDPIVYLPFGAGPRQCIATRLALLEVKIAVSHVLRTHRFVMAPETEVPVKFANNAGLLKPENGIWLRVEKHSSA